ncbi:MAG: hypothetical protein RLN63_05475, partial [Miltoncostaeaceae bacterium]
MTIRTSPRLTDMPHYEPGLTTAEVLKRFGLTSAVKLASNESPFPPMPEVAEAVAGGVATLNRYPDGPARTLRRDLAERHGVDPAQVTVGNGSCELLLLAGQALLDPGTTVMSAMIVGQRDIDCAGAGGRRQVAVEAERGRRG